MFALQRQLLEEWVADQVRGLSPGPPDREGSAAAGQVSILRRTVTGIAPLLGAIALIGLAGLFAAIDAAISTRVGGARRRADARTSDPAPVRLARVVAERPRYINLVVLLRIACEVTATVLLVAYLDGRLGVGWGLTAAAAIMTVVSFVAIGVGPRTLGRQHAYTLRVDGGATVAGDFGSADPDQPAARSDR